ncbi:MAG: NADPH:quinone oxidoreductase [Pseudomonas sp.]|nr:NADPH:quinone oxidoreductase [Pseudomonas sp.]|tara:strand:- start:16316 stop:16897 length:582 start_codon:yes stop_codon:yes gene_type:complete
MRTVHLLGLCGSLRHASSNAVILRTLAKELLPAAVHLHIHDLHDLPLYNGDADGDFAPSSVRALREAVELAEGLVIGSPEYNQGMSGVLKNALDWLSAPHRQSPLKGKPTITFTGTPSVAGGARAQQQLNETLWAMQASLVPYPQIVIADVDAKIRDGRLWDEAARQFLIQGVSVLVTMSRETAALKSSLVCA